MGVWPIRFRALTLVLGEPSLTVPKAVPEPMHYAWPCGCLATTADGMNCLATPCGEHVALFPIQTAMKGEDERPLSRVAGSDYYEEA